jgi:hypothetical protein
VRLRNDRGATALELVMVAPVLLLLLAVTLAAGRVISAKSAVLASARDAARTASDEPDPQAAAAVAEAAAVNTAVAHGLDSRRLTIELSPGDFERGGRYLVEVGYVVQLVDLPGWGVLPGLLSVHGHHAETIDRYRSR